MERSRLDVWMVLNGLAESRSQAERMIMAGEVLVDGEPAVRPAARLAEGARVSLKDRPRFVSRGGDKLAAALQAFHLNPGGLACADVGASTGGFSDCLLQHGARRVYAVEVGRGQLDWRLRNDPRVVVMEGVNARHLAALPEPVGAVTVDASFISLGLLLPVLAGWLAEDDPAAWIVTLIKPQFEAGRRESARGRGVIRDPLVHRQVLQAVIGHAGRCGLHLHGLQRSPLLGPKGNLEFLAVWRRQPAELLDERAAVQAALEPAGE